MHGVGQRTKNGWGHVTPLRFHLSLHITCYSTTTETPPLRLDPGAAFLVSAWHAGACLHTPPPSPGATRNSLLQQILGEARLSGGS